MIDKAGLRAEVKEWAERPDFTDSRIDSFIDMVEDDYRGDFYVPSNERIMTYTTDANGRISIPLDFLKVKFMEGTNTEGRAITIYRKSHDTTVNRNSIMGEFPVMFERRGTEFIFSPNVGTGYSVTLTYYGLFPELTDSATNPVFDIMANVYLFGCLHYLHMYVHDEERAAYFGQKHQNAKASFVEVQEKAEMAGSPMAVFPALNDGGFN
tara:strand:+ start:8311 stop:8940 length:630 start_codon:yes stop_codon:yes gene_type:complete